MKLTFNELPILEQTKEALTKLGFEYPTEIQELAIPKMIEGIDLIGQAQTGTGKTFAFSIPMIEKTDPMFKHTQGLILTPTRELAVQVYKEIIKLVKFYPALKVTTIVGGESYDKQFKELEKNPHIIVATPGRIIDHINRRTVDLSHVHTITLDEADEMLKMGFQEDLETILQTLPEERQTVLFSATMPPFIKKIATNYQKNPVILKVKSETLTVEKIQQSYFLVKKSEKDKLITRVLDYEMPKSAIIFCNTKMDVDNLSDLLQKKNYNADALHGDLKQAQRNYVMNRFRNKQLNLLIATDVAARGLDVNDVDLIINYDLPQQDEIYVHRIGRTGRAGKTGRATTFVTPREVNNFSALTKFTKSTIEKRVIPEDEEIYQKRISNFKVNIKDSLNPNTLNHLALLKSFIKTEEDKDLLINTLLENLVPKFTEYEQIEFVKERVKREESSRRDTRNRNNNNTDNKKQSRGRRERNSDFKGNYVDYTINLGKSDGFNPQKLFGLLETEFDIFARNVGDISHEKNQTTFGIKKGAVKRFKYNKKVNYQGKMLKIYELK